MPMIRAIRQMGLPLLLILPTAAPPVAAAAGGFSLDPVPTFVAFTPASVELDPLDQTLWIADRFLPRVAHLGADGSLISVFAAARYGGGRPGGLAFEGSGGAGLYVSDPDFQRIIRVDRLGNPAGGFSTVSLGIGDPLDLAWNAASGTLWVADPLAMRVFELRPRDADGDGLPDAADLVGSFDTQSLGSNNPMGLALDPASGHLFVSDPALDRVFEVTPDGAEVASFDSGLYGGTSVTGLAWDAPAGRLRLADAGRKILTMSPSGAPLGSQSTVPLGSLSFQGLTWDPATATLVVVTGERKMIQFQPDSPDATGAPGGIVTWRQEWTSVFSALAPSGIALDPASGDRFVSDSLQHRVFRVNHLGGLVSTFDAAGAGSLSTSGLAMVPSSGSLLLSDNQARKIFEVTAAGALVSSFTSSPFKHKPPSEPLCNDPRGVTYDATRDHLFIADFQAARVFEVTRSGSFVAAFSTAPGAPYPADLTVDPATDRIVVADSTGFVAEFSRSGTPIRRYPGVPVRVRISGASGVSVDPSSLQRVVTDPLQDAVTFLSPGGTVTAQVSLEPYGLQAPSGAAWSGSDNRLYVADKPTQRFFWVSPGPDGAFGTADDSSASTSTAAVGSPAPTGAVLDRSQGSVGWVDEQSSRLFWVTTDFNYLGSVDLAPAGAGALRGVDQDPTSRYLFASDAVAGFLVTDPSGSGVWSASSSEFGIGDLGGSGLSPREGTLVAVDRSDRTLVQVNLSAILLPEVAGLVFADPVWMSWTSSPFFSGYQVFRGSLEQLPQGSYGGCFWAGTSPPAPDGGTPAEGEGWFYLAVGTNPTGTGSLGTRSDGAPRSLAGVVPRCP